MNGINFLASNFNSRAKTTSTTKYAVTSFGTQASLITNGSLYGCTGIAASSDYTKIVFCIYSPTGNGYLYYSTYSGGSWSTIATFDTTARAWIGIALSADGTRGAAIVRNGYCYYFTWTGSAPSAISQTLNTNTYTWADIAMSADGSRIAVVSGYTGYGYVYYATWDGTNYSTFTQTLDTTTRKYNSISMSADGSIIVYGSQVDSFIPRYATWNGSSNYSDSSNLGSTSWTFTRIRMTTDAYTIFIENGGYIYYCIYSGSSYGSWTQISASSVKYGAWWAMNVANNNKYFICQDHATSNSYQTQLNY